LTHTKEDNQHHKTLNLKATTITLQSPTQRRRFSAKPHIHPSKSYPRGAISAKRML